jgi:hypothetical protein
MGRAFRNLVTFIFAVVQLVAMVLFLMVCFGGMRGMIGAPNAAAATALSVCAASAAVCGYGCFRIYKCRALTISSTLSSIYAATAIWYFWAVVLPSFHG